MSFQAMAWATEQELPTMQKFVLVMMANRTNHDTGLCCPSHERLARDCGMSKRSVIEQIKKLEIIGLVSVIRSSNENGVNNVNKYILNLNKNSSAGDALHSEGDAPGGSAGDAHKPVNPLNQKIEPNTYADSEPIIINTIFNFWKEIMKSPRSMLDADREKSIKKALKVGRSIDDIKLAIKGCSLTPYNMGQNDNNKKYNDITLILRDAKHIEAFMESAINPPKPKKNNPYGEHQEPKRKYFN